MAEPAELVPATTEDLETRVLASGPREAAELLATFDDRRISEVLQKINPAVAQDILEAFDEDRKRSILAAAPRATGEQWARNETYDEGTIGRLMEPPTAVLKPSMTIAQTIAVIGDLVKRTLVTYGYVIDDQKKLVGVITMRDLLFSRPEQKLEDVMLKNPFFLRPETELMEAMKQVLHRHFPVYPVCDQEGRLIGQIRGQAMFEEQAYEISAQAGTMVGVDKEERLTTPWPRSLKFRHPWLQLNLLTAFVAAFVVGIFQGTIDQIVVLAVFLPVLAGQSGNTGCQALAVTLRGLTLGELKRGKERVLVIKEALLGFLNGALVGVSAGVGMYVVATMQKNDAPLVLALIVFTAMVGSCVISGISGALIPLTLRKLGADPATASSIFLTTATDVASMGIFLGLATLFLMR